MGSRSALAWVALAALLRQRLAGFALLCVIAVSAMLVACGGAKSPSCDLPGRVGLTLVGTKKLNPDGAGKPLPTVVRFYQLSDPGKASRASFEALWQDGAGTLGDTSLTEDEVTLYPKDKVHREFSRDPKASYILAVAIFRQPDQGQWRKLLRLPPSLGEQRCAAASAEEASEPANAKVYLRADGYRLSGHVRLDFSGVAGDVAKEHAGEAGGAAAGGAI